MMRLPVMLVQPVLPDVIARHPQYSVNVIRIVGLGFRSHCQAVVVFD